MPQSARKIKEKEFTGEFVVGGYDYYARTIKPLDTTDRVEKRLTRETIRRMRLDGEIESSIEFLKDAVFSDGLEIVSAILDEEAEDFNESARIADFCREAIKDTVRGCEAVLQEMFTAAFMSGVKTGEIVLKYSERLEGRLVIDRINPKPNSATAFVTDKFYNVIGMVGAKRAGERPSSAITLSKDEIIPREKFLVLAFELEDNDPRGISKARSTYEDWCDKRITREQWREWRSTSAIPKKVGITPQGAKEIPLRNPDGSPKMAGGVVQTESPQKNLMNALEGFKNNSTVTAPFGTVIEQLEVTGNGEQFALAWKTQNTGIRKSILGDALATGEADKDARAARQSAMNIVDLKIRNLRNAVCRAFRCDILRLLVLVNFGAEKLHLTPGASLGDTERRDWATDLNAARLAGYEFAPEHMPELDAQFGMKPRAEAEPAEEKKGEEEPG